MFYTLGETCLSNTTQCFVQVTGVFLEFHGSGTDCFEMARLHIALNLAIDHTIKLTTDWRKTKSFLAMGDCMWERN